MSAQNISGLADVIRQAREALAGVPAVAEDMKNTTARVLGKVKQVQALVGELKSAETELDGVLSNTGNGAPPLETSTASAQIIPASLPAEPADGIHDDTGAVVRQNLSH